ncbi:methionine ABC transporter ATP-binding protein [Oceanirhabdus sp. W0125-5]|uniref:methionine ABC transporter ATP-binding protein n=1 Tax=Oceanirhabdus sp. W0125-5 TaxID=2999116 RepID=UPI0022F31E5B|nr:ATP-binding cassette domain-containing protein [Oceanirhabdus sp. W0125-5]WBW99653.1 ATP-binding cassette domain-containing protein [Oceanirhabdus sp. W0125-5]
MIKINNLEKTFNQKFKTFKALDNINLQLEKGKIHGIIGESGAGKSTLLRCINRLETPTKGTIEINGTNIMSLSDKELRNFRQNIGMIFQNFNLLSTRTVYDNIAFPLELSKVPKEEIHTRVMELLALVSLSTKASSYPAELSGGQKQRVAIARALANNPEFLLCDEATSALDPKTTKQILELLKSINKKFNITIILITHEMDVIKEICNTVTHLIDGKCLYSGRCSDFFIDYEKKIHKDSLINEKKDIIDSCHGKVIYLTYTHSSAKAPIISRLSRLLNIDVNIINGQIDSIGDIVLGNLVIEIEDNNLILNKTLEFLKESSVEAEVIK